jgi:outer membrane usher protein FimD/PapC
MPLFKTATRKELALALSLMCASLVALAAGEEGMFLDLKVNHMQRGEFPMYRSAEGDFLIRLSDVTQLGLRRDLTLPLVRIEGESGSFVSLRELGARNVTLDATQTALDIELPAELFETTSIDLANQASPHSLPAERSSGFLNCRLADTTFGALESSQSLATEVGLRYGSVLLLDQRQFRAAGDQSRYLTQLVYDRPEEQQRLIAGDFTGISGELGSVLPMGGIHFSKVYGLTPELIRQPLAGFTGIATSPSTVEVRMGGVPVAYSQVAAGPFELQNLRQYGGASDVQVMVRDALGREQVYNYPFYFSDTSLREGLQEYSYSLGKIRVNPGQANDSYENSAFSAFHRFGYSDALTLGARAEASQDLNNFGLEATWRSDQFGVLAGALSHSNYQGQSGEAGILAYTFLQPNFGLRAVARRYSDHYAPLETLTGTFERSGEYGLSLSWYPGFGSSINVNHTLTQMRDQGDSRVTGLSYFLNLDQSNMLYVTLQRTDDAYKPNTSLFIGWFYRFADKYTASVNATRDETGQQTLVTQLQRDQPHGEGVGYRVGWTGTQPGNRDRFNGSGQWNLPAVSLSLDANAYPTQGGNADYRELAAAGSIAFAGTAWGFSRPITDSFAIVQLGAPVAGVHVSANSQDIGVSDENGQVISPYLGSFYESQISVNDQDIPLQYVMGKNFFVTKPAYRSGVDVNFGLRRVRAIDGVLRIRRGAEAPTADQQLVNLVRDGHLAQQFQVGSNGRFYIENISPGNYHGEIKTAQEACSFSLNVPDTEDVVFTLPGDLVCEHAP